MVKIRVSYDRPEQLKKVIRLVDAEMVSCRLAKGQEGQHRRAYIILRD